VNAGGVPGGGTEKNSTQVVIHVTARLRERLQALADAEEMPLGRWCRDTLLLEADRLDGGEDQ
jgi:hypothetical protein